MHEVLIIEKGRLLDPSQGLDGIGDLVVVDGCFVEKPPASAILRRVDASGCWILPGLLDLHAHFREPGGEASESLQSGSEAAARGGFTRVVTMPNTTPPMDDPALVRLHRGLSETLPADLLPAACCTLGRAGAELADLPALRDAGAAAFTDDGSMVEDDDVMERVMRQAARIDALVMDHAVVPERAAGGVVRAGELAHIHGLAVFPDEAEVEAIERDIRLCRRTGCRTHLQHLSCAASLDLLRAARREGLPVTAEVTPHHLLLALEDIPGDDANWKMNPPLGTRSDVAALRAALAEGVISCCATDHAPHTAALKEGGFRSAMFGVLGLETAVGVTVQALVVEMGWSPLAWAAVWTTGPARVLGLPPPSLKPGARADVCIVRPEPWTVEPSCLLSRSRNSPFLGRTLFGHVLRTIKAGRVTYPFAGRDEPAGYA